ncbi:Acp5 [Symbiodinium pilosum]|uniref:Acp5 protein n=1 Tax=Symbiodinium pilosum TaxID=2952 RepID=A0A812U4A3_SYMPI|nr:Acp5 [Symbiodinium pilosum]
MLHAALLFIACLRLVEAKVLLFWAVDGSKRTQDMVRKNIRHVEDAGVPHDVILAHYRGTDKDWDHKWYKKHVSESLVARGYKFHLMQKAYKEGLWEKHYEFVWALDSDIDLSQADIQRFLALARLTQSPIVGPTFVQANGKPLLMQEHSAMVRREGHAPSKDAHRHAHQISGPNAIQSPDAGCDFRHTDFVELTAPLLKSHVLKLVLRDCNACIHDKSDWGLDMMWCKYASERLKNQACALIDSTPVIHMDWGLAPISQEFYKALNAVQARYDIYWSDRRVLDCKQRGEGLVEIPEGEEGAAQTGKKHSLKKAANSTRQKATGESDTATKAEDQQSENEDEPPEEVQTEDGLPLDSQSKASSEGESVDDEAEEEEEEQDADAVPSKNKTAQTPTRAGSNSSKQAAKKAKEHSSSAAAASKEGSRKQASAGKEEDQEEDGGLEGGQPKDDVVDDEAEEEEEEQDADAVPSKNKTSQTPTRAGSNSSKQAAKKAKEHSSSAAAASKAGSRNQASAGEEEEDSDDAPDVDTAVNTSHTKDKPARSVPGEGIFKVKATQDPMLNAGSLHRSMGEPTVASKRILQAGKATAQTKEAKEKTGSKSKAANDSPPEYQDVSLGDEENLDLDWPAEMDAETKKSDPSMHESYATNAETKQGEQVDGNSGAQSVHGGQDDTIEFQEATMAVHPFVVEVSQSRGSPGSQDAASATAFEEAEQRLRDDIESLKKLEEDLRLLKKAPGQEKQNEKQNNAQKSSKAKVEGNGASHKRRKGHAALAVSHQAVSLLDLGSAPASEEELQALQIQKLAAGQREVAMQALQEVEASLGSSMTADQLDRSRRAAIESVRHAIAEQVDAQERQQSVKVEGATSELSAQHTGNEVELSHAVTLLKAELAEAKKVAEKDRQVEEQKMSALEERLAHQRSEPDRHNEDKLLMARAKQIMQLKAQVRWDSQRLSKEKEDEVVLKNKIKQLEDKLQLRTHASFREAHSKTAKHKHAQGLQKVQAHAVEVDHSGLAVPTQTADVACMEPCAGVDDAEIDFSCISYRTQPGQFNPITSVQALKSSGVSSFSKGKSVAAAMERLAERLQPEFILSLGDNFYIRGVADSEDSQFQESFEDIYSYGHLSEIPWQITIGDHDHRGNVSAMLHRPQRNPRWRLPAPYYSFRLPIGQKEVRFIIVDSVGLEGGMLEHTPKGRRFEQDLSEEFAGGKAGEAQWSWLSESLANADGSSLQVVVGHRPIRSLADRGKHGAAPPEAAAAEALKEALLKAPQPVLYLHGHDHVMQHFRESEHEVHHLGNGVGGMGLHPLKNCSNCSEFQWGTSAHGFAVHELAKDFLATHFVDAETHEVLHSVVIPF